MEPLIFKIETQADDSGVRQYDKSLGGLDVSSKKASGALKNFVKSLSEAKDGTDIASSALGAFGQVLGSSIAGTAIIIAGKTLIDSFNKINQAVKESEKAVAEAFAGMDKASEAMSFAEATAQAKNFESVAEKIRKKINEINESPLDNIINAITQSTAVLDINAMLAENQAKEIRRLGAESELAHIKKMQGLDAENKALELNSRALAKELDGVSAISESETALAITRKYQLQADEIRAKFADDRNKTEAENASTRQKEIDAQIKKEQELTATQQKRFNDLYDAEVKAQEATQKRIDANLKGEQDLIDQRKALVEDVAKAESAPIGAGGVGGGGPSFGGGGGGGAVPGLNTRGPGQRETSAQKGAREAGERAYERGRKAETERTQKNIGEQLKAQGKPFDPYAVNNEITRRGEEFADLQGRNSEGLKDSNDAYENAKQKLRDFDSGLKSSGQATTDYSAGLSQSLSDLSPSFQSAMDSATNLADSIMENSGNMVEDFMNTGSSASDLGGDFSDLGKSANDLSDQLKKSSGGGGGGGKPSGDGAGGSLASIEKLLQRNFDELKAYAHAT